MPAQQRGGDHSERRDARPVARLALGLIAVLSLAPAIGPRPVAAAEPALSVHNLSQSLALPIRAAFYYPWFPEAWTQGGVHPFTNYHPSLGLYSSGDPGVIAAHIEAMRYGGIQAGIASWWGRGTPTDARFQALLDGAHGTGFRWSIYYEQEGYSDPSPAQISGDLRYIDTRYGPDPSILRVGGRIVVFVYGGILTPGRPDEDCTMADRWKRGSAASGATFYLVLKVFPGYRACASQPDAWHQYAPADAEDLQPGNSISISPGFWLAGQPAALARDRDRWTQNVRDLEDADVPWKLVTTFNEWGEGTAVENATEWDSSSRHGTYLDVLHSNGVVFQDGFESGDLSQWTSSGGLTVETAVRHTGSHGVEGRTTDGATYAKKLLPSTYTNAYARVFFDLLSGPSRVNLLRLRTSNDSSIVLVGVDASGRLLLSTTSGTTASYTSTTTVPEGTWHSIELHGVVNGPASLTEVWLDGRSVADLSRTVDLGTTAIGRLQIGEVQAGRTYDIVFDDAAFDTHRIR